MFSFVDYLPLFTCIIADLVQEHAIVCELCWFTIHLAFHSPGPQIVSLQSHDWFFWTNPSIMGVWKVHYLWGILYKKCQKHGEGMFPLKTKCHIWTHRTQIPLWIPISFYYLKKNFCSWKPLHSHSFGHVIWTWKLWVVLPGELISLIVAIPTFCLAYPVLSVWSDQRKGLFQLIIFMWTII